MTTDAARLKIDAQLARLSELITARQRRLKLMLDGGHAMDALSEGLKILDAADRLMNQLDALGSAYKAWQSNPKAKGRKR